MLLLFAFTTQARPQSKEPELALMLPLLAGSLIVLCRSAAFTPLQGSHTPWIRRLLKRTEVRAPGISRPGRLWPAALASYGLH
jgi:hypothetical protein